MSDWNIKEADPSLSSNPLMKFYIGESEQSGEMIFIKEYLWGSNQGLKRKFISEVDFYSRVTHPNIIRPKLIEENKDTGRLFLPYMENGDLFQAIFDKHVLVTPSKMLKFAYNLINVVQNIHSKGVLHLDLKLENILAVQFDSDTENNQYIDPDSFLVIDGGSVTPCYAPPEYFLYNIISPAYDMWTVGMILYLMIAKSYPYDRKYQPEYSFFDEKVWKDYRDLTLLVKNLLSLDPKERLQAKEALDSEVFSIFR